MVKLPRNSGELTVLFRGAEAPELTELQGEYWVDMLTGLPSLKLLAHRKRFHTEGGSISGHNLLFGRWIWGRFGLEPGTCRDMGDLPAVLINYDRDGNSFVSRPMRDYVRRIEPGLYLGRLYYAVGAGLACLGFFSLERM
jgi:hypothetical protein